MNTNNRKPGQGVEPPAELVEAIRRLVEESSEEAVAAKLDIGRAAVARLKVGAPVRRGTIALARERLGIA